MTSPAQAATTPPFTVEQIDADLYSIDLRAIAHAEGDAYRRSDGVEVLTALGDGVCRPDDRAIDRGLYDLLTAAKRRRKGAR